MSERGVSDPALRDAVLRDPKAAAAASPPARGGAGRTILEAQGLRKSYRMGAATLDVVRGIDLQVRADEIVAIVGPSGAGKSTLLHMLGLLETPDEGRVFLDAVDCFALPDGARAAYRGQKLGFVFQFYHLFKDLDAVENVCLPRMVRDSIFRYDKKATRERATHLLERVGLAERLRHRPSQLSGGERQRVAIARALVNDPLILLCDEPTGNLDSHTAGGILELLWKLKEETHTTFVVVTHDEGLAARADRSVRVVDGRIVKRG